ncbi:MAG: pyridoxamine 5'-phosphate oxidase [Gammaproteobacteria bacterium]
MNLDTQGSTGLHDALARFHELWNRARADEPWESDAMTLATVSAQGRVRARTVLLKRADETGFVFYTNYESRKGNDLETNPQAALCFFWRTLRRQVTVEGQVHRLDADTSDAYFATRNRRAQLGAWASAQSRPLAARTELEARLCELELQYAGQEVPRPPHWGGYCLVPDLIEFWSPGEGRLNERERYFLDPESGNWQFELLNP